MSQSRPLLVPWLRDQIDSGRFPGVQWTNPEKTEFCIPWKHALRQDSCDTDVLIFKAWSEVSGNCRMPGDPSIWKRNFRSALRAKGFKMVSDDKNDGANPHKVFRWPEESTQKVNTSPASNNGEEHRALEDYPFPVQESHPVQRFEDLFHPQETVYGSDILQQCMQGLNIGPPPGSQAASEPLAEQQQLQNHNVIGAQASPQQRHFPVTFQDADTEAVLPGQPEHPIGGAVGGPSDGQWGLQIRNTFKETFDGDQFKTQFQVNVLYRGRNVLRKLVENEAGFCLVYRPELSCPVVDPQSGLTLVSLPSPADMLDQKQAQLTQNILYGLGVGLEIRLLNNVIYGQRRGDTKAFWSLSKFDHSRQPQEISKHEPQPLYQIREFCEKLTDFMEGREGHPCSLFFCLGERWPDPEDRPWIKKLVTVEVVFTSMELLKNLAVEGGASSMKSVELQISLDEMMDML
ncbi:interferon regulatory factor 3 [Neosynchiropus ocellatus]